MADVAAAAGAAPTAAVARPPPVPVSGSIAGSDPPFPRLGLARPSPVSYHALPLSSTSISSRRFSDPMAAASTSSTSAGTAAPTPPRASEDASGEASRRFAGAKSISSDQYFGRGDFAENDQQTAAARVRLAHLAGRAGFGSADLFPEAEAAPLIAPVDARAAATRLANRATDDLAALLRAAAARARDAVAAAAAALRPGGAS
ncbi:hypothetical protein HK405_008346 [Cladochytrium tenue]|nr:hypothetical protein HK405_008346 [Cladochytrium tenue]